MHHARWVHNDTDATSVMPNAQARQWRRPHVGAASRHGGAAAHCPCHGAVRKHGGSSIPRIAERCCQQGSVSTGTRASCRIAMLPLHHHPVLAPRHCWRAAFQPSLVLFQAQRFRIKEKAYGQYAQSYFVRLTLMRPLLAARAATEFPGIPCALQDGLCIVLPFRWSARAAAGLCARQLLPKTWMQCCSRC